MACVVHANLDCEATWAGVPLPGGVVQRISLYGALVATLAPADGDVEVWVPAPVDAARLRPAPAWHVPRMRVGVPPRADLAWADPAARAVNDRRLALQVAVAERFALSGARTIAHVDEIQLAGPWVCKAPWTSAGRDRCHGVGAPSREARTRIERLLARHGALVLEPWCDRLVDVGVCARGAARRPGRRSPRSATSARSRSTRSRIARARSDASTPCARSTRATRSAGSRDRSPLASASRASGSGGVSPTARSS
jgi:hypothetical protein